MFTSSTGKLPTILQTEAAECGLACLAMVLGFHGHNIDLPSLRSKLAVSLKGMNLAQLIEAATVFQLSSRPLRLELNELKDLQTPCVLHWDMNHFVVLKSVRGNMLTIHDPAQGVRKLSIKDASRHFTGVALELATMPDFEAKKEKQTIKLGELFGRVMGLAQQLGMIFVISIAIELCGLISPLYVQFTVDHALLSGDKDLITLLAMAFLLLGLIQIGVQTLRSWIVLTMSTHISIQWSVNVFAHLIRLPQAYFEKRHLGDIVSRFGSIASIQRTLTTSFIEAVLDGIMACITLAMMLTYSPQLTLLSIAVLVLYGLLRVTAYGPLRRATEEQIVLGAKQQSVFLESARGIQAIKLFGREGQRQVMWHNRLIETTNRVLKTEQFMIGYKLAFGLLMAIETVASMWIGSQLVLANVFSVGMLFAFLAYKSVFAARVGSLVNKAFELKMLGLQAERLADIVLTKRETTEQSKPIDKLTDNAVEIKNLSFRYSDVDPYVIKNLTVRIAGGQSTAIIGPSGCGKTTLAKLVLGLLKAEDGEVCVQGLPIEKLGLGNYRQRVNAVMQDDQLFAGSLAENISFFDEKIDQDKVERVAKLAFVHEEILSMAMGYNTLVGDMGTALSGGQKQRVLLARALYRDPDILVLDEATSHLDIELEKAVNHAIKSLPCTRIVIAHRPETIASCDHIVDLGALARARD
jgi:ATP-binding cassette, subfamily B, bacterial CvaB/MchF/RaxB